jgi:hypothetical protein
MIMHEPEPWIIDIGYRTELPESYRLGFCQFRVLHYAAGWVQNQGYIVKPG